MRNFCKLILKSKTGQTSVEYILLVSVIMTMLFGVTKQIRGFLFDDADNCTQGSKSLVCKLENSFKFGGGEGQGFRFFTLRR